MPAVIEVTLVEGADFPFSEAAWSRLCARDPLATPFQSWAWLSTWWRKLGRGDLFVLGARQGGELIGALPLTRTRYRHLPFYQLRFLGAPHSDYQAVIAASDERAACQRAFLQFLSENCEEWDFCDLADLPRRDAEAWAATAPASLDVVQEHHRFCPAIALQGSWDQYLSSLSKNTRTNLGRRQRQIEKTFKTELETVRAGDVRPAMRELFELHNRRWKERRFSGGGAFASAAVQAFHLEVAQSFAEKEILRLHRLRLDGVTRAAFYCFGMNGRVYYYLSGFDLEFSKYSLGNVMMGYAVKQAFSEGAKSFELLRGDETYKFSWGASESETKRLLVGHHALRSRLGLALHRGERRLEHFGLRMQRKLWGRKKKPNEKAKQITV